MTHNHRSPSSCEPALPSPSVPTTSSALKLSSSTRNAIQKHVWRARIILESARGYGTMEIMRRTGKSKVCVWRWQRRYMLEGVDGLLHDATRPSGWARVSEAKVREVIDLTNSSPDGEATHWTLRAMAARVGLAFSTVRAIWRKHGLVPHCLRVFKLSTDPAFVDKLRDVVGLYNLPRT